MSFLESESLLSCLKEKALAHFEKEVLKTADNCTFKVAFTIGSVRFQADEFQNYRIFDDV